MRAEIIVITPTELYTMILRARQGGGNRVVLGVPAALFGRPVQVGDSIEVPGGISGRAVAFQYDQFGRRCVMLSFHVDDLEQAMTAALRGERPKDVMSETEFNARRR